MKLFWELEGRSILSSAKETSGPVNKIDKSWLQTVFDGVGDVVAETVKAAAECGSFGLQLMPNAFEVSPYRICSITFEGEADTCRLYLPIDIWRRSTPLVRLSRRTGTTNHHTSGIQCIARLHSIREPAS